MKRVSLAMALAAIFPVWGVTQTITQQAVSDPANHPAATPKAQAQEITNARIIEMTKLGLDDEVIIARIKHGSCHFQLADPDLVELKQAGVSPKVVAAMLEAPSLSETAATPTSTAKEDPSNEPNDGKIRIFVTDSQSWENRGGGAAGGNKNGWGGSSWFSGGARPQTAEIIKTLNERCPEFTITNNLDKALYVVTLDHEGGKGALAHRNKVAVFNHNGDVIFSHSTRELGNAVKDACTAIHSDHK